MLHCHDIKVDYLDILIINFLLWPVTCIMECASEDNKYRKEHDVINYHLTATYKWDLTIVMSVVHYTPTCSAGKAQKPIFYNFFLIPTQ